MNHIPLIKPDIIDADSESSIPATFQLDSFCSEINTQIIQINSLIDQFNDETGSQKRIKILQTIFVMQQAMEASVSDRQVTKCASYRQSIHVDLFNAMKEECGELGIKSIYNLLSASPQKRLNAVSSDTISELLASMSPEKVSNFTQRLVTWAGSDQQTLSLSLGELYSPDDSEGKQFRNFLATHSIRYLGGINGKNFIIEPGNLVLKVDNRKGAPREAEMVLRDSMGDALNPVYIARQAAYDEDTKFPQVRTIIVTKYCPGGDLETYANAEPQRTDVQQISTALHVYSQMGNILEEMRHNRCGFIDMKNSNWLVDDQEVLRMADTKSFIFLDTEGRIDLSLRENRWCSFLNTPFLNPPEISPYLPPMEPISAEKAQVHMLGKNLYQYLTHCHSYKLDTQDSGQDYDFEKSVFNTPSGEALKQLIIDMIKPDPDARISMKEVLDRLEKIKELHSHCEETVGTCKSFKERLTATKGDESDETESSTAAPGH